MEAMETAATTNTTASAASVDLGFLEEIEPWLLTNRFFPSKVGGKPAWLDLANIPAVDQTKCPTCAETMVFLCQVYAPSDKHEHAFHRTIFLFVCKTGTCWVPNSAITIVALRSQLPRINQFYSAEAPDEDTKQEPIPVPVRLCELCGIRGPSQCARCKKTSYCSRLHQKIDWKSGHSNSCNPDDNQRDVSDAHFLLPEFDIALERDSCANDSDDDVDEDAADSDDNEEDEAAGKRSNEHRRRKEASDLLARQAADDSTAALTETDLMTYASGEQDAVFAKFRKRIGPNADQVLRYDRGNEPLWIGAENQLVSSLVPQCELCCSPREFEFQIMPQLLNTLKCPELDWGIINVYTCQKQCNTNGQYAKEFCYKQDVM